MSTTERSQWTFLSNHAHVIIYLAQHPEARLRDIADAVGITERFAHRIVSELEAEGYVSATRAGRRKTYDVNEQLPFRHPLERGAHISELLKIFPLVD